MAIIRQKRKKRFSIVDNNVIEDKQLSFKARGLLIYMLSKPDDWKFYPDELAKHSDKEGVKAINSALQEIESAGYLTRKRKRGAAGHFQGIDYLLSEIPHDNDPQSQNRNAGKRNTDLRNAGKRNTDLRNAGNGILPNTDFKPNTDHTNKDDDDQPVEDAFNLAQLAGINVNSGLNLPVFTDYINRLGNELVCYAIRRTNDVAQHPSWSYLKTVLKSLENNHVKTVEQAEELSKKYGQSRKGKSSPQKSGKKPQYHFETREAPEGMSQTEAIAKELAEAEAEDKAKEERDDS